jgi:hypothetical protein
MASREQEQAIPFYFSIIRNTSLIHEENASDF